MGDKLGLAQLDLEKTIYLQLSCAGVGVGTCPTAGHSVWARSFGKWHRLNVFGLFIYQGLDIGLSEGHGDAEGLSKAVQSKHGSFSHQAVIFLPNVLMCVRAKYETMLTKSGELLIFAGPKLSQQMVLDFLCNTKVSCDK